MANLYQVTAIQGQTVFDLPFSYAPGSNELFVFWNGQLLYSGVGYTETSSSQVLLAFAAEAGDQFTFRIPAGSFANIQSPAVFSFAAAIARPTTAPVLIYTS